MEENNTDINQNTTSLNNNNYFGSTYKNEKEKSQKGKSMLQEIEEQNINLKEREKLYEDIKITHVELFYNKDKSKLEYKDIIIGGNKLKNIKDIDINKFPGDEDIKDFLMFFDEIEDKVKTEYNNKNEFSIILDIKGDPKKNDKNLECLYELKINDKVFNYRDFDIIHNGVSVGFEQLLVDLNNFKD